jgi:hypothetical protein
VCGREEGRVLGCKIGGFLQLLLIILLDLLDIGVLSEEVV